MKDKKGENLISKYEGGKLWGSESRKVNKNQPAFFVDFVGTVLTIALFQSTIHITEVFVISNLS